MYRYMYRYTYMYVCMLCTYVGVYIYIHTYIYVCVCAPRIPHAKQPKTKPDKCNQGMKLDSTLSFAAAASIAVERHHIGLR